VPGGGAVGPCEMPKARDVNAIDEPEAHEIHEAGEGDESEVGADGLLAGRHAERRSALLDRERHLSIETGPGRFQFRLLTVLVASPN